MIQLRLRDEAQNNGMQHNGTQPTTDPAYLREMQEALQGLLAAKYEVIRPLAAGGMAVVFQLRHRVHGGLFAAKVLHRNLRRHHGMVEGFRREAVHLARLGDHPNLIAVLDCDFNGPLPYLLFPFVEGDDLDRVVRRKPFCRNEALHMAAQLSSALCHMESHGIVHGDVTPGNIRLDVFGRSLLMDFGLSRKTGEDEAPVAAGTPLYTSPEQILGQHADHRADLYALGLALVESLTGQPLIQGDSIAAIHAQHVSGAWSLPEVVQEDPALRQLLLRLLAKDREDRFGSAFELSGALSAMGFQRPEFQKAMPPPSAPTGRRRLQPLSAPTGQ